MLPLRIGVFLAWNLFAPLSCVLVATAASAGRIVASDAGAISRRLDATPPEAALVAKWRILHNRARRETRGGLINIPASAERVSELTSDRVIPVDDIAEQSEAANENVRKTRNSSDAYFTNDQNSRVGLELSFGGRTENSVSSISKNDGSKVTKLDDGSEKSNTRVYLNHNETISKSSASEVNGSKEDATTNKPSLTSTRVKDDDEEESGWGAALEAFLRGGSDGTTSSGPEGLVAAAGARLQRLLGAAAEATAEVADVLAEVPRQILLLPIRLGFYPGLTRQQEEIPKLAPFPCAAAVNAARAKPGVPTSVHRLRPGDIRVVAALGDSLTAANGALAYTEDETRLNYRGVSAYGGGEGTWRQYLTMPNILKEFNPKLLGYALGVGEAGAAEAVGAVPTAGAKAGFNLARNGALDDELLGQAKRLVTALQAHPYVDVLNDWKLVNVLAGGNDLCNEYCYSGGGEAGRHSPEGHARALRAAIDYLQQHLPRTFVNLVHMPNLLLLKEMHNVPIACHLKQLVLCSCLFGGAEGPKKESVARMLRGYWRAEREVASDPKYEGEDFAVALQPFFLGVQFPGEVATWFGDAPPLSYFAPDCFHFSQKGNALAANALWNNMMEPEGHKTLGWQPLLKRFLCPNESAPFLFTHTNSKLFLDTGKQFQ